ncbi:hypothetical protein [Nonomuraea zeae]|uniref:hypothetical protein n=1 Tax=Nonomuraea zeae TaxID=1642303 RepID=UPI0014795D8B|nr:hypothetical protein [Nonomuraea zeae]
MLDFSPFVHVPVMLLSDASSPVAPLGLTGAAVALATAGLAFLRLDLMPSA